MESKGVQKELRKQGPSLFTTSACVGIGTGAIGASISSGYATVRGLPVLLWTAASGVQCFVLGSTFWFSRGLSRTLLEPQQRTEKMPFRKELACSTIAGSIAGIAGGALRGRANVIAGVAGGALRGRANVIPGAIVCGLIGLSGQAVVSTLGAVVSEPHDSRPLLDRLSDTKWWPMKSIPDAEYKQQLLRQIDGIDVEISMVDDQISALKQQRQAQSAKD